VIYLSYDYFSHSLSLYFSHANLVGYLQAKTIFFPHVLGGINTFFKTLYLLFFSYFAENETLGQQKITLGTPS
jgi:hypothetical protein